MATWKEAIGQMAAQNQEWGLRNPAFAQFLSDGWREEGFVQEDGPGAYSCGAGTRSNYQRLSQASEQEVNAFLQQRGLSSEEGWTSIDR